MREEKATVSIDGYESSDQRFQGSYPIPRWYRRNRLYHIYESRKRLAIVGLLFNVRDYGIYEFRSSATWIAYRSIIACGSTVTTGIGIAELVRWAGG